jgi:hypothetical protein
MKRLMGCDAEILMAAECVFRLFHFWNVTESENLQSIKFFGLMNVHF